MSKAIISTPAANKYNSRVSGQNDLFQFEYCELQGRRDSQEDTLVWTPLNGELFISKTPETIGKKLCNAHLKIDSDLDRKDATTIGSTASTTVYDGHGNLITATLGDAVSFIAIYKNNGRVEVRRLNSIIHEPENEAEAKRVRKAGGTILEDPWGGLRVSGALNISRSFGDRMYTGIMAEPSIDILNLNDFDLLTDPEISHIQIITACDGLTERAKLQTKAGHEAYLCNILQEHSNQDQPVSAEMLAQRALNDGSQDNISVAIQTLKRDNASQAFLIGVYDGHGGAQISNAVASQIIRVFKECCHELTVENLEQVELNDPNINEELKPAAFKNFEQVTLNEPTINEQLVTLYNQLKPKKKADREIYTATCSFIGAINAANSAEETLAACTQYEQACNFKPSRHRVAKIISALIIATVFAVMGITLGAAAGITLGIICGAWTGPGAALSALVGLFSGSVTGWALGVAAAGSITGVALSASALSGSLYGFFSANSVETATKQLTANIREATSPTI